MASRSVACTLALLVLGVPLVADAAPRRMPVWPTEVRRVAAPLYPASTPGEASDERVRVRALQDLDVFATAAIEGPLLHALEDPAMVVRREALRLCYERTVAACVPLAVKQWNDAREPTLRVSALKVIALEPTGERAGLLRDALKDGGETVRAQAAEFLGWAPLSEDERERARAALVAKLADVSAVVRRQAVESLGLLGGDEATLAVARLLDDPEPTVRAAAATAMGRLHDDRGVPALRRALDSPNEPLVTKAIVRALAQLGDAEVEDDLLALLDDPPTGLDAAQIADAIGRRPQAGEGLVEGLVQRLREPGQREAVTDALRLLGDRARPQLEKARARGLEAPLRVEIDALLGEPGTALVVSAPWPDVEDRTGWRDRLESGAEDEQLAAGAELGRRAPPWLGGAVAGALVNASDLDGRRGWLAALATTTEGVALDGMLVWARLIGWAKDRGRAPGDRCLAVLAASGAGGDTRREVSAQIATLADDPSPVLRACVVQASARLRAVQPVAAGLADPSARVRAAAALALGDPGLELGAPDLGRLAMLRARDSVGQVRTAAALALQRRAAPRRSSGPLWSVTLGPELPWVDAAPWVALAFEAPPERAWAPAFPLGRLRVLWAPGLRDATPEAPEDL